MHVHGGKVVIDPVGSAGTASELAHNVHCLPPDLAAVLVTHVHPNHVNRLAVQLLQERYGNDLSWFVPFPFGRFLQEQGCRRVTETFFGARYTVCDKITFLSMPTTHKTCNNLSPIKSACNTMSSSKTVLWSVLFALLYNILYSLPEWYENAGPFTVVVITLALYLLIFILYVLLVATFKYIGLWTSDHPAEWIFVA